MHFDATQSIQIANKWFDEDQDYHPFDQFIIIWLQIGKHAHTHTRSHTYGHTLSTIYYIMNTGKWLWRAPLGSRTIANDGKWQMDEMNKHCDDKKKRANMTPKRKYTNGVCVCVYVCVWVHTIFEITKKKSNHTRRPTYENRKEFIYI